MSGPRSKLLTIIALLCCAMHVCVLRTHAQQSPHGPLSIPCTDCHTTESWTILADSLHFNHSATAFPLKGQHNSVPCVRCHASKKFSGTPDACIDCHQKEFTDALAPNHALGKFPHDCTLCHTFFTWQPSVFQHSKTNFPLAGAHQTLDCASCHANDHFAGLPSDCFSCHQQDFVRQQNPNHQASQFSHDCTVCHAVNAWNPAVIDHNKTMFPLTGVHRTTDCIFCHKSGVFNGAPTDCYSCHRADYNSTTNPNHALANYPKDCSPCHTPAAWQPSTFDHSTFFPINASAVHRPGRWNLCSDCHTNPSNFQTFSCFQCHAQASTTSAHREVSGFAYDSNACYRCHPQGRGGG
jgi:hypothetical protein